MMKRLLSAILLLSLLASCSMIDHKTYDFSTLTFNYPGNWREMGDVTSFYKTGQYFFSMHIFEDLTLTSAKHDGEPGMYFSVASLEHPYEGVEVFRYWMYGMLADYTEEMVETTTSIDGFKATRHQYTRRLGPEGETPWYQFKDIWVDTGPLIYLLSFYAEDLTGYQEEIDMIVDSFRFKYHSAAVPGQVSPGITFGASESN